MGEPNQFRYSEELRESTGKQAIPRDHRRLSKDQPEHARLNLHSRTYGQRNAGNWYCRERMTSARDLQEGMAFIIPVLQIEDARAICTIAAVVRRTLILPPWNAPAFWPSSRSRPVRSESLRGSEQGRSFRPPQMLMKMVATISTYPRTSSSSCTSACMASYYALFIGMD
jgi:hypothetical protein